jgi:hypothetical protein
MYLMGSTRLDGNEKGSLWIVKQTEEAVNGSMVFTRAIIGN